MASLLKSNTSFSIERLLRIYPGLETPDKFEIQTGKFYVLFQIPDSVFMNWKDDESETSTLKMWDEMVSHFIKTAPLSLQRNISVQPERKTRDILYFKIYAQKAHKLLRSLIEDGYLQFGSGPFPEPVTSCTKDAIGYSLAALTKMLLVNEENDSLRLDRSSICIRELLKQLNNSNTVTRIEVTERPFQWEIIIPKTIMDQRIPSFVGKTLEDFKDVLEIQFVPQKTVEKKKIEKLEASNLIETFLGSCDFYALSKHELIDIGASTVLILESLWIRKDYAKVLGELSRTSVRNLVFIISSIICSSRLKDKWGRFTLISEGFCCQVFLALNKKRRDLSRIGLDLKYTFQDYLYQKEYRSTHSRCDCMSFREDPG
jgi:hypothetical protein